MLLIQNLTADPLQQQSLVLPDGSQLLIEIYYRPQQYGWFFNTIQNKGFSVKGIRITNNSNMLRQWKNLINFGLACYTDGNREPTQQQDFLSGAAKLYVLTAAEVLEYEKFIQGD